jgi:hypothetical protein
MSSSTAKDLLAQADRLMRQRAPEELPVLTDLVIEEIELVGFDVANARPAWLSPQPRDPVATSAPPVAASSVLAALPDAPTATRFDRDHEPTTATGAALGTFPRMSYADAPSAAAASHPITATPMPSPTHSGRDQFNAQLISKLEELQHSVYSQVMQQLELYAAGSLKTHLRETLLPALTDIANDIANQVAEDTSTQVREVLSKAVDSEIARLRLQLAAKRS